MKNVKEMTDAELDKLRRSTIWWTDKGQRAVQEELKHRTDAVACEKTVAVDPISADAHYIALHSALAMTLGKHQAESSSTCGSFLCCCP